MKTKYIIIITAAILVTIGILLYTIHLQSERILVQQFYSQQSSRINFITVELENNLQERLNDVNVISSFQSVQDMDMKMMEEDIQRFISIEKINSVRAVNVFDKNGTIIYSTSKKAIGRNCSKLDFFQWAINNINKGKQFISTAFQKTDSVNGLQTDLDLLLTTPIYKKATGAKNSEQADELLGIVTTTLNFKELLSSFFTLLEGHSVVENFFILDRDGTLIFSYHHPEMVLRNVNSHNNICYSCHESFSHFKTILSKQEGTITYVSKDEEIISSFGSLKIDNISWRLAVWTPSRVIFDVTRGNLDLTLLLTGIFLLTILSSGFLVLNRNRLKIKAEEETKQLQQKIKLEESIRSSEAKFKTLIEQSPFVIEIYDLNGMQISVNKAYEELWNFTAETTLFKFNVLESKEVEDTGLMEYIKRAYDGEVVTPPEYRFNSKGDTEAKGLGRVRWLSTKIYPTKDVSGKVINIVITHQDITERKQSEEEVDKLVEIVKHSAELVNLSTLDGKMIFLNESGSKMLGIEPHEVDKVNIMEVVPEHLIRTVENELLPALMKGETWEGELQYRNLKTGKLTDVHTMAFTIKGKTTGEPLYLANVSLDITKRKRAEQIQKVLYNISNAVITTDDLKRFIGLVQKELGTIIDTTNFYVALYDSETDTISIPFFIDEKDIVNSFPTEETLAKYVIRTKKSLLITKEKIKELENAGEFKHFGTYAEIWLGVPLKVGEKVTGVMAVQSYTDKTAYSESDVEMIEFMADHIGIYIGRKRTDQELKDALVNATESDRLKSAFLATMSHELRTPLSAILGFSDIINKEMSIDNIVKYIKNINTCGNQLQQIIDELFDITLIESGEIKINNENVQVQTVIDDVNEIIKIEQQNTNKNHIDLILTCPSERKDLIINTDPSKLKQILINLLKNALRFTNTGFIDYGYTIATDNGQPILKFHVKDTGIGIKEDQQKIIFDIFRQVDDSSTKIYGGTGIGLSIAKKLVEYLGGRIWVESNESKLYNGPPTNQKVKDGGSTFYFTIPFEEHKIVDKTDETDRDTESEKYVNGNKHIILIVEDNEQWFEFLEYLLTKPDIHIMRAKNGEDSIKLCRENINIDLILMDINLPIMNGYEATIEIKKFRPDLPVIAQTAYAIKGDREKSFEAGCDDYISKPFKEEALMKMINYHLKKKKSS